MEQNGKTLHTPVGAEENQTSWVFGCRTQMIELAKSRAQSIRKTSNLTWTVSGCCFC